MNYGTKSGLGKAMGVVGEYLLGADDRKRQKKADARKDELFKMQQEQHERQGELTDLNIEEKKGMLSQMTYDNNIARITRDVMAGRDVDPDLYNMTFGDKYAYAPDPQTGQYSVWDRESGRQADKREFYSHANRLTTTGMENAVKIAHSIDALSAAHEEEIRQSKDMFLNLGVPEHRAKMLAKTALTADKIADLNFDWERIQRGDIPEDPMELLVPKGKEYKNPHTQTFGDRRLQWDPNTQTWFDPIEGGQRNVEGGQRNKELTSWENQKMPEKLAALSEQYGFFNNPREATTTLMEVYEHLRLVEEMNPLTAKRTIRANLDEALQEDSPFRETIKKRWGRDIEEVNELEILDALKKHILGQTGGGTEELITDTEEISSIVNSMSEEEFLETFKDDQPRDELIALYNQFREKETTPASQPGAQPTSEDRPFWEWETTPQTAPVSTEPINLKERPKPGLGRAWENYRNQGGDRYSPETRRRQDEFIKSTAGSAVKNIYNVTLADVVNETSRRMDQSNPYTGIIEAPVAYMEVLGDIMSQPLVEALVEAYGGVENTLRAIQQWCQTRYDEPENVPAIVAMEEFTEESIMRAQGGNEAFMNPVPTFRNNQYEDVVSGFREQHGRPQPPGLGR